MIREMEFERFACCRDCWAPQAVCHKFDEALINGRWGYKWVKGRRCQFAGVLRGATVALQNDSWRHTVPKDWMEEEMVRVGFDKGREEMEEISKWKQWM